MPWTRCWVVSTKLGTAKLGNNCCSSMHLKTKRNRQDKYPSWRAWRFLFYTDSVLAFRSDRRNDVEYDERKSTENEDHCREDRIIPIEDVVHIVCRHYAESDEHGEQSPLQVAQRIRTPCWKRDLEIARFHPFLDHRHLLAVAIFEKLPKDRSDRPEDDQCDNDWFHSSSLVGYSGCAS